MKPAALPLHQHLCFALYSANNAMGGLYRSLLGELGLTYPQYLVLLALWEKGEMAVGALGKELYLESNTLTPLLKRMEAAGLVTRKRDVDDERLVMVSLTTEGKALEAKAHDVGICVAGVAGADGDVDLASLRDEIIALADRLRGHR